MRYLKYIYTAIMGLLLAACQAEQWEGMEGGFRIALEEDVNVTTKSTPAELGEPTADLFSLKIVKESTGNTLYDGKYTPGTIPASAGQYTITATCGENPVLALDAPYYKGEETGVVLAANETKSVALTCKVANALASVTFNEPERFESNFSYYAVTVKVGNYSASLTGSDTRSAYYQAGSMPEFRFVGVLRDNGQEVSTELTNGMLTDAANFAAGKHCKLNVSLEKTPSGVVLTVEKVEVENVTISETIPLEWLPKPKLEATGFDASNTLSFAETETKEAAIGLNLSSGLQDLKLTFDFGDERLTAYNKEYVLSTLSEEDKKDIEETLGITLPAIGSTTASVDLSALLAKLQTNAGATTINTLTVDAKANNRWSSDDTEANRKYTLTCNKPEFTVSVESANCWSREFTVDEITVTAGNAETLKSNLAYQYYNGTDWVECATREGVKGRTQQFADSAKYITKKEYQVRALYRGAIASDEAEAKLETPTQLPNSGMEDWSYTSSKTGSITGYTYYTFFPYPEKSTDIWWNTNNERSQDGVKAGYLSYIGCFSPCVSYTETTKKSGTRSALIYTSGHGGGYASTSSTLYEEGAFAGSLFIGKYSWSDKTETITPGHAFAVRPTKLKFHYKYIPKNSDSFKAYIELRNSGETDPIATGTFIPQAISSETGWMEAEISLKYVEQPKEATSIYVQFLSTTKTSFTEDDFDKNQSITFPVMGVWNAHIGSKLYIDDISLIYDK